MCKLPNVIPKSNTTFRINPLNPWKIQHLGQHVYMWFILPIYGVYVILESIGKYASMRS